MIHVRDVAGVQKPGNDHDSNLRGRLWNMQIAKMKMMLINHNALSGPISTAEMVTMSRSIHDSDWQCSMTDAQFAQRLVQQVMQGDDAGCT